MVIDAIHTMWHNYLTHGKPVKDMVLNALRFVEHRPHLSLLHLDFSRISLSTDS
ncbi:hypothetical protein [Methanoculleus horonobensis]|uniref:hypothetical protein n=1 Tax=Methanoculleus horonobensis TaxID=528314 RepID=UPI000B1E6F02